MIYFAQRKSDGLVKIGMTISLKKRMNTLKCLSGSEVEVLALIVGGRQEESELHARFGHLREDGEWFRAGQELMDHIGSLPVIDDQSERVPLMVEISPDHMRLLEELTKKGKWYKRIAVELAIEALRERMDTLPESRWVSG